MKGNGIQGVQQQERWCFPWWIKNDRLFFVLKFWNFALRRHVFFWNSKFTIQNPKKENHRNHHGDHPLSSKSQWQRAANSNKPHWDVVSNSVRKRIGKKKFCKRPFFTVEITILRTTSSVFWIFCASVDFQWHCTWPKEALEMLLLMQLSFSEG